MYDNKNLKAVEIWINDKEIVPMICELEHVKVGEYLGYGHISPSHLYYSLVTQPANCYREGGELLKYYLKDGVDISCCRLCGDSGCYSISCVFEEKDFEVHLEIWGRESRDNHLFFNFYPYEYYEEIKKLEIWANEEKRG